MKYNMLIIARYCAFDTAAYAGSKSHNYYLKKFNRDFTVKLITFANPDEASKLDFKDYGIDADVTFVDERPQHALFFLKYNWMNIYNYFGKTYGLVNGYIQRCIVQKAQKLSRQAYRPDVVIFEWTQASLTIDKVKKIFPNALFIASEHDIAFQRVERLYKAAGAIRRIKELLRLRSLIKYEMKTLHTADLVVTHSKKDRDLLVSNGIDTHKMHVIVPYYTNFSDVHYTGRSRNILFFGAMDRPENYESIIWFIEQVFNPYLSETFSLCIVGGRPHESLQRYRSEKIVVTGFVPDIRNALSACICKVVPLRQGAGIKVKVIEAMSAGIPVLANTIGIEGIPAQHGIHYLHCETPEDYKAAFEKIAAGNIDLASISNNAKKLVAETFNLDVSYEAYRAAIVTRIEQHSAAQH